MYGGQGPQRAGYWRSSGTRPPPTPLLKPAPMSAATADDFYRYTRDSFDVLYREGASQPKMLSVGLHMRISGHPGQAAGLERLLDYLLEHQEVWICRRIDIARHWITQHPFPATR
jgi:allantoinase